MKSLLLLFLLCPLAATAANWSPNLTVTAAWNDNATNADRADDRIGALQTTADVVANERYGLGRSDSLHLGFHAAAEWWPRFQDLMTGAIGARAEWQHKFGLGALAPVFSLEGGVDLVGADDTGRRGTSTIITAALRKRFNDLWRASLTQEFSQHYARFAVYDRQGAQTTLEIGRDLNESSRLTFALSYRDGDVLSHATPPRPDIVPLAPNRMPVDTFRRPFVAYSVDARTLGARFAYIRALDEASALVVAVEYRDTERSPLRYVNHLVSVGLVHQF